MRSLVGALVALVVALTFHTAAAKPAPLKIGYDAEHLDTAKGVLQFKPSRAITTASLVVTAEDGSEIARVDGSFEGQKAGTWQTLAWTPTAARVMKLVLRVEAGDGVITTVTLIPWSVTVEHEDVTFASDSAVIEPSEQAKLDASLESIVKIAAGAEKQMKLKLFVAGHTDTVGASAANRTLSLARARAIAAYFQSKGLELPIAFAGYGEDVLLVKTGDNTDERRNRRADYVLGPAAGAPPFKGPYLKVKTAWKALPPKK